jgi:glutaminase
MHSGDATGFPFISTGQLPTPEAITALVDDAHARFRSNNEGENSQVYPALAQVRGDLFGVCVVSIRGNVYEVGDTQYEFSIMSVSKPFVPTVNSAGASKNLAASTGGRRNSFLGR